MNSNARKEDILTLGIFSKEELTKNEHARMSSIFKSIEYYEVHHYTNEELYHMDEETEKTFQEMADLIEDTPKGRIYCMS